MARKKVIVSKPYQLIKQDLVKWGKNARKYAVPALVVFLTEIQAGVPLREALRSVYLWGLNTTIDLLTKWMKENKY